ncbi:MAG: PorP/SprF family type IX secretion system membrane protein [Bacteroidetes bacterium]|nr:PorP/SprF family type IX secretion system membrane protein [Bacteroidota bacterium]
MKKQLLLFLSFAFAFIAKAQQDPQYNLYQFNQMVINPAYAGARDGLSVVTSVRNQWAGFKGAPKTSCMSIHGPILNKNLGVGLTVISDAMGPRNMVGVYGNVAYILKLNTKWKLSFGINAGYNRFQFDFRDINFKVTENSSFNLQNQSYNALDINSGLYLRSNTFFVGISSSHLQNKTLYSYQFADTSGGKTSTTSISYRLRTHTVFMIGKSFKINDHLIFAPTILTRRVGAHGNGDLNLNFFLYNKLWLGVFMKGGYGPGFLFQYYISNKLRVAYSYDTGMKDARRLGPSHEVMLGFDFSGTKAKMLNPRFL